MGLSSSLEGIYVVIYEYLCWIRRVSIRALKWALNSRVEKKFGWTDDVTNNLIRQWRHGTPFLPSLRLRNL